VAEVFSTQRQLEGEVRQLQTSLGAGHLFFVASATGSTSLTGAPCTAKFTKMSGQWIALVDNFNLALKVGGSSRRAAGTISPSEKQT
jgi:hypothetical protein